MRRGMVILGVLVVVAMAALAGTTAMYLANAELAASRSALKRAQARAMAWSGVQAVMAELADQRDKLLDGGTPDLTQRWELFAEDGVRGVVRLSPVIAEGPTAVSEASKLDLNTATVEMLGALGLDEKTAGAIVAARAKGPFSSVGDLVRIDGIDMTLLEAERAVPRDAGVQSRGGRGVEPDPGRRAGWLQEAVTVFSFDPNVQVGLGKNGSEHRGRARLNVHTAWSDRLAGAVDERFGEGASAGLKAVFDQGTTFKTIGDVAAVAGRQGLKPENWPPVLDALTCTEDPYQVGLVDLNHAGQDVLAAVPGISKSAAEQIVQSREKLDEDSRRTVCWPVIQGLLTTEEFLKAVDHLTARSMQWRIRVEAGFGRGEEGMSRSEEAEEALTDRVVLEAVIDVASERPRVAYLRDSTLQAAMATVYAQASSKEPEERERDVEPADTGPTGPTGATGDSGDLHLGPDAPMNADLHLHTDLDLGWSKDKSNAGGGPDPINKGAPATAPEAPAAGVDRRVGRWTVGGGKGAGG